MIVPSSRPDLDAHEGALQHQVLDCSVDLVERSTVHLDRVVVEVRGDDPRADRRDALGLVDGLVGADSTTCDRSQHGDEHQRDEAGDREPEDELPDGDRCDQIRRS